VDDLRDVAPHVASAIEYAEGVRDGEIVACKLTRQACLRFLSDLHRDWQYCLDTYEAERACDFIESLPHIKGEWAKRGELLILEGWQCFIVVNVFGWRDEEGLRRFKTIYVEVARKNAKSTLAAAIGLYMLIEDGEEGAEVYSAATTRDQAKIVFNTARQMALRTTALPLEVRAHNISYPDTASLFQALHAQGNTLDGYNIHCAINDELHAWSNRAVYDVLETATGSRLQPLMFNITTAGVNATGVCWDTRQYVVRILKQQAEDERVFGVIYTLDKNDDWSDEKVWPKANPNLNVSVYLDDLRAQAAKASEIASQQNGFLTKRMNVWVSSAIAWMNMTKWNDCVDDNLRLSDFDGEPCWGGLDVASKVDVTSACQLFKKDVNGEEHFYAFMRHWLPEHAVAEEPTGLYDGWVREGWIRTTPGNIIDTDQIESEIMEEIVGPYDLREIGVDPMHNSTQISVHLAQQGVETVDVRPTVLNFSEPMKWLEALVKDGRFHTNCPVLTWMISNVEVKVDFKDNIYPRKSGPNKKIDGVIAPSTDQWPMMRLTSPVTKDW
jgi:phage terminase large subunit-like protein